MKPTASMELQMEAAGLPPHEAEFRFHVPEPGEKARRWRFDYAWPKLGIALEIEGGTYARGRSRHTSAVGFGKDCEKYSVAAIQGWAVIRADAVMVRNGMALDLLEKALDSVDTRNKNRQTLFG